MIEKQPANRWPMEMGSLDVWLVRGRDQPFREHSEQQRFSLTLLPSLSLFLCFFLFLC